MENGPLTTQEGKASWRSLNTRHKYFTDVGTCTFCYVALVHFVNEAFEFLGLTQLNHF